MRTRKSAPGRQGISFVELLVVIALIGILVGLLVLAIQRARTSAMRTKSTNNVKQIVLAFHGFHDTHRRLPYNGTVLPYRINDVLYGGPAVPGNAHTGSWAFMILPFVDEEPLFHTRNPIGGVGVFMCDGRRRPRTCVDISEPGAWTDFFINSFLNDPNGVWNVRDAKRSMSGIIDGASNTIFVGQGQINPLHYQESRTMAGFTDSIYHGGSPGMCRPNRAVVNARDSINPPAVPGNWGGPFVDGSLMAMGDGAVRIFPYSITGGFITDGECQPGSFPDPFGFYLTPSGGEVPGSNTAIGGGGNNDDRTIARY